MYILSKIDSLIINFTQKIGIQFARLSIFVVYFWFGILKLVGESPANDLVNNLLQQTLSFLSFQEFIIILGVYEIIIGIVFLIPRMERVAIFILIPHLFITIMPLILLPAITWQSMFIPTLEGQYIIKNILILAVALGIATHLNPVRPKIFVTQR